MSEEWSDWFLHDGRGCPVPIGVFVHNVYADGSEFIGIRAGRTLSRASPSPYFGPKYITSWDWSSPGRNVPITRYRIRKPRGMTILEGLLENLPATVEGVDA